MSYTSENVIALIAKAIKLRKGDIEADISSLDDAYKLVSSEFATLRSQALADFETLYSQKETDKNTLELEALSQALQAVQNARDIIVNDDGDSSVIDTLAEMEAQIEQELDNFNTAKSNYEQLLQDARDLIATDFGTFSEYSNSYDTSYTSQTISGGQSSEEEEDTAGGGIGFVEDDLIINSMIVYQDAEGNSYSTMTNLNGEFVLEAIPVGDITAIGGYQQGEGDQAEEIGELKINVDLVTVDEDGNNVYGITPSTTLMSYMMDEGLQAQQAKEGFRNHIDEITGVTEGVPTNFDTYLPKKSISKKLSTLSMASDDAVQALAARNQNIAINSLLDLTVDYDESAKNANYSLVQRNFKKKEAYKSLAKVLKNKYSGLSTTVSTGASTLVIPSNKVTSHSTSNNPENTFHMAFLGSYDSSLIDDVNILARTNQQNQQNNPSHQLKEKTKAHLFGDVLNMVKKQSKSFKLSTIYSNPDDRKLSYADEYRNHLKTSVSSLVKNIGNNSVHSNLIKNNQNTNSIRFNYNILNDGTYQPGFRVYHLGYHITTNVLDAKSKLNSTKILNDHNNKLNTIYNDSVTNTLIPVIVPITLSSPTDIVVNDSLQFRILREGGEIKIKSLSNVEYLVGSTEYESALKLIYSLSAKYPDTENHPLWDDIFALYQNLKYKTKSISAFDAHFNPSEPYIFNDGVFGSQPYSGYISNQLDPILSLTKSRYGYHHLIGTLNNQGYRGALSDMKPTNLINPYDDLVSQLTLSNGVIIRKPDSAYIELARTTVQDNSIYFNNPNYDPAIGRLFNIAINSHERIGKFHSYTWEQDGPYRFNDIPNLQDYIESSIPSIYEGLIGSNVPSLSKEFDNQPFVFINPNSLPQPSNTTFLERLQEELKALDLSEFGISQNFKNALSDLLFKAPQYYHGHISKESLITSDETGTEFIEVNDGTPELKTIMDNFISEFESLVGPSISQEIENTKNINGITNYDTNFYVRKEVLLERIWNDIHEMIISFAPADISPRRSNLMINRFTNPGNSYLKEYGRGTKRTESTPINRNSSIIENFWGSFDYTHKLADEKIVNIFADDPLSESDDQYLGNNTRIWKEFLFWSIHNLYARISGTINKLFPDNSGLRDKINIFIYDHIYRSDLMYDKDNNIPFKQIFEYLGHQSTEAFLKQLELKYNDPNSIFSTNIEIYEYIMNLEHYRKLMSYYAKHNDDMPRSLTFSLSPYNNTSQYSQFWNTTSTTSHRGSTEEYVGGNIFVDNEWNNRIQLFEEGARGYADARAHFDNKRTEILSKINSSNYHSNTHKKDLAKMLVPSFDSVMNYGYWRTSNSSVIQDEFFSHAVLNYERVITPSWWDDELTNTSIPVTFKDIFLMHELKAETGTSIFRRESEGWRYFFRPEVAEVDLTSVRFSLGSNAAVVLSLPYVFRRFYEKVPNVAQGNSFNSIVGEDYLSRGANYVTGLYALGYWLQGRSTSFETFDSYSEDYISSDIEETIYQFVKRAGAVGSSINIPALIEDFKTLKSELDKRHYFSQSHWMKINPSDSNFLDSFDGLKQEAQNLLDKVNQLSQTNEVAAIKQLLQDLFVREERMINYVLPALVPKPVVEEVVEVVEEVEEGTYEGSEFNGIGTDLLDLDDELLAEYYYYEDEDGGFDGIGTDLLDTTPESIAINGYFPLYVTEEAANAHEGGNGTAHTHEFNGITYYMPNGLTMGVDMFHGDYVDPSEASVSDSSDSSESLEYYYYGGTDEGGGFEGIGTNLLDIEDIEFLDVDGNGEPDWWGLLAPNVTYFEDKPFYVTMFNHGTLENKTASGGNIRGFEAKLVEFGYGQGTDTALAAWVDYVRFGVLPDNVAHTGILQNNLRVELGVDITEWNNSGINGWLSQVQNSYSQLNYSDAADRWGSTPFNTWKRKHVFPLFKTEEDGGILANGKSVLDGMTFTGNADIVIGIKEIFNFNPNFINYLHQAIEVIEAGNGVPVNPLSLDTDGDGIFDFYNLTSPGIQGFEDHAFKYVVANHGTLEEYGPGPKIRGFEANLAEYGYGQGTDTALAHYVNWLRFGGDDNWPTLVENLRVELGVEQSEWNEIYQRLTSYIPTEYRKYDWDKVSNKPASYWEYSVPHWLYDSDINFVKRKISNMTFTGNADIVEAFKEIFNFTVSFSNNRDQALRVIGAGNGVIPIPDADGDGVADSEDVFPNDPTRSSLNASSAYDNDGDGEPDWWDAVAPGVALFEDKPYKNVMFNHGTFENKTVIDENIGGFEAALVEHGYSQGTDTALAKWVDYVRFNVAPDGYASFFERKNWIKNELWINELGGSAEDWDNLRYDNLAGSTTINHFLSGFISTLYKQLNYQLDGNGERPAISNFANNPDLRYNVNPNLTNYRSGYQLYRYDLPNISALLDTLTFTGNPDTVEAFKEIFKFGAEFYDLIVSAQTELRKNIKENN